MTLQEITQFIDDRRIQGYGYGIVDEDGNLRAVLSEDFDYKYLTGSLRIEKDAGVRINDVDIGGDNFILSTLVVDLDGEFYDETFYLRPVRVYSSEKVKQIVNKIQEDE